MSKRSCEKASHKCGRDDTSSVFVAFSGVQFRNRARIGKCSHEFLVRSSLDEVATCGRQLEELREQFVSKRRT